MISYMFLQKNPKNNFPSRMPNRELDPMLPAEGGAEVPGVPEERRLSYLLLEI